ncbi:hypothetical protein Hanom_Chr10g00915141 [Helianthus anomalus]
MYQVKNHKNTSQQIESTTLDIPNCTIHKNKRTFHFHFGTGSVTPSPRPPPPPASTAATASSPRHHDIRILIASVLLRRRRCGRRCRCVCVTGTRGLVVGGHEDGVGVRPKHCDKSMTGLRFPENLIERGKGERCAAGFFL